MLIEPYNLVFRQAFYIVWREFFGYNGGRAI